MSDQFFKNKVLHIALDTILKVSNHQFRNPLFEFNILQFNLI